MKDLNLPPDLRAWLPDSEGAMRKARLRKSMVAIMRNADRDTVSAVAQRHGISEQFDS